MLPKGKAQTKANKRQLVDIAWLGDTLQSVMSYVPTIYNIYFIRQGTL